MDKFHQKTDPHTKFYLNRTMRKCSNPETNCRGERLNSGWGRIQGGGECRQKKCKRHKWHPKINLYSEFSQNRKMKKSSKIRRKGMGEKEKI